MNARDLFDAIGFVDDDLIEAADQPPAHRASPWQRLAVPLAACLCLAAGIRAGQMLAPANTAAPAAMAAEPPAGESVAPELNSEAAPDIDGQESAPESYALMPDTPEPKAQTATPEQGLPDALLQLILPGENTGGSCYFGYSADDLALPDSLAVQDDRLLPETLPVYPSAMLEGNVQEERMRAQLAEVLTALGLDAASAETAALTYGSELERGMTPNSVIGWAMAAKLSLTVDACEAAPYGLEIEVTNDGWVWARPAVGNAADAATYASRAEAEAAAADAAVRHAGLIGLAGGEPQAICYHNGLNYDGTDAEGWQFRFYDASGAATGSVPVETGDWGRLRLDLDADGALMGFSWFDYACGEPVNAPVRSRTEAEQDLRAGRYASPGGGAGLAEGEIVAARLVYEAARGTSYFVPFWCFTMDGGLYEDYAPGLHEYFNCYVPAVPLDAVPELAAVSE